MAPPPLPPVPLPVDPILFAGPVLIGILFTYLLFGVLLAQVAQYYQTVAASDKNWLRILVAVVVVIQFLQLSFITDNAWTVCVLGYLDPMNLISPPISAPGTGVLNGMVSLCVQMFFVWKIYSLAQKSKVFIGVAGLVAVLSVLQFGASIGITTKFIMVNREAIRLHELKTPITIHLVTTAACDTVITLAMIVILSHYKDNTVFVKTKSLLNTLIIATIENGLITSVTAIGNLIIYFTRTQDMINIAFQYVIGGLYAIVLITTLNRRSPTDRSECTDISLSDVNGFNTSRNNNSSTGRGPAPSYQVNVLTTVDRKSDPEAMMTTTSHEYGGKRAQY
ncbi:hypothetical protein FA13DRAFT_1787202 [Coprinellus micaceus]|uniref:DUF6534 domain-containing protein n=1 Tax=Coprinellus micaceus TaxID=71717 RepID=A0A4Y7TTK2_COPMI|nr:hypothetical protein FA13DRAFT_1787202 [Coprinellus micaceus]